MAFDMAELGRRVKETRVYLYWTQDMLAERVGCSVSHVADIERGRTDPKVSTVIAIANAFDVRAEWLILGDDKSSVWRRRR